MTTDTPAAAPITAEREALHEAALRINRLILMSSAKAQQTTDDPPEDRITDADIDRAEAELLAHIRAALSAPVAAQPAASGVDRDPHFGGSSYDASLLRELLAVIHRDGGHYIAQHGIEKACADAAAKWLAAPAAQRADSAMDTERMDWLEQFYTDTALALRVWQEFMCNVAACGFREAIDRARALVAKETPHG